MLRASWVSTVDSVRKTALNFGLFRAAPRRPRPRRPCKLVTLTPASLHVVKTSTPIYTDEDRLIRFHPCRSVAKNSLELGFPTGPPVSYQSHKEEPSWPTKAEVAAV